MAAARTMSATEWALLAVLSVLWGGSFLFVAVAVAELPPLTLVLARVALAALALQLVAVVTGQHRAIQGRWPAFAGMGLLNNVIPFSLIFWSQTRITGGLASVLNATAPLWTVLLAHWLTRDERLTAGRLAGVLVGLVGVAVMVGPSALTGLGGDLLSQLAVLVAALSYAFSGIYGCRFKGLPPLVTAARQLTSSAVMMLPIALIADRPWLLKAPSSTAMAAVLALALLSTAAAYVIFFRILLKAGATNILLVTFLIPPSAMLLGHVFLAEPVEPRQLAAMALIGLGLAAIDGRPLARLRRRAPA
jgi:drug/metabolite transporter (DMT)-like permease